MHAPLGVPERQQVEVVPFHRHVQRREAGAQPVSEEGGESTGRPAGAAGELKVTSIGPPPAWVDERLVRGSRNAVQRPTPRQEVRKHMRKDWEMAASGGKRSK
ncbi:hypothetical protein A1Q2_01639 [Trichosporon asahii var. asahii CBS 8904]|uniref:Uncharacterized protein n=1 Tax=Trichosporon asahii var. asahii (strain CBS 8904) TaxID=1220162 RepID=K1VU44_TRIAC|nr:hypothetical protein A1Q2_01639 [Trichosporon asahii var. asahii CBS 8904]